MFIRFALCAFLLLPIFALAGEYWHVEPGAGSMKMLSMPTSPRSAALSGAGIASPRSESEAMRNPLAPVSGNSPSLSFSKTEFSEYIGASKVSMLAHSMLGSWHLTAGMESLNFDEIEGYNDDGLTSDGSSFAAGTIATQLGIARTFNSLSAGLTVRYANQNVEDYNRSGILFDGGVKYDFQKYFAFGAIFSNFGWIEKETAPLSVQAGITGICPLVLGFTSALSADLYRRNDFQEPELRSGLEIMYKEVFSLRFGYPISSEENNALSAGFAIKLGFADIEYAYQNRTALKANHIFGISLYFF
ncbi:MAG: hypothetical protein LBC87_04160 [Fibromonadaceae bacterium]|nr:hypothetical protein [Fibromonadaceae bacterium]